MSEVETEETAMRSNMDDKPEEFRTSDEWVKHTGIEILDPDGWDRTDFENSWNELISEEEFLLRCYRSTINAQAFMLYDKRRKSNAMLRGLRP